MGKSVHAQFAALPHLTAVQGKGQYSRKHNHCTKKQTCLGILV